MRLIPQKFGVRHIVLLIVAVGLLAGLWVTLLYLQWENDVTRIDELYFERQTLMHKMEHPPMNTPERRAELKQMTDEIKRLRRKFGLPHDPRLGSNRLGSK